MAYRRDKCLRHTHHHQSFRQHQEKTHKGKENLLNTHIFYPKDQWAHSLDMLLLRMRY